MCDGVVWWVVMVMCDGDIVMVMCDGDGGTFFQNHRGQQRTESRAEQGRETGSGQVAKKSKRSDIQKVGKDSLSAK